MVIQVYSHYNLPERQLKMEKEGKRRERNDRTREGLYLLELYFCT